MTISTLGHTVPRDVRSRETARIFALLSEAGEAEQETLLEQVVTLNIQVAHAIARRYQNRGVPVEDLEQVACLALVRAARRFDHTLERDFLSYLDAQASKVLEDIRTKKALNDDLTASLKGAIATFKPLFRPE